MKPTPLKRARAGKYGFYDPNSKEKALLGKKVKGIEFKALHGCIAFFTFNFCMPKSWSKKKRNQLIGTPHEQRPDATNLAKFIEDALNDIFWKDDCILHTVISKKQWAEDDSVTIRLYC